MPELPEVETLKLGLQKYIAGQTIEDIEIKNKRIFSGDLKDIVGAKVVKIERFGKGLVIELNNGFSLAIHIKLTGQLIYRSFSLPPGEKRIEVPNKFTHVVFHLNGKPSRAESRDAFLYYNDVRQFGWIKVVKSSKLKEQSFFRDLGPEFPLVKKENNLTYAKFREILSKSRLAVKPLIMDQKKMAGIGNIYANDALWLAKINPKNPANSLSDKESKALFEALLTVLKKGLQEGGASELTFVNILGEKGNYQEHTLVYGKTGKPCKRCGTKIIRTTLGGRGTFTCSKCQV